MSASPIKVPASIIRMIVLILGRDNEGAQIALFNPDKVSSYIIWMSKSTFATPKKAVSDLTKPSSMYLHSCDVVSFYLILALESRSGSSH
jgi:hypothetical protein